MTHRFRETLTPHDRVRQIIKEPSRVVTDKMIHHMDEFGRRFIA